MKAVIVIATLLSILAVINATPAEKSSDIVDALRQYGYLSTRNVLALKEDLGSDDDDIDSGKLLLSSILQGDEDGEQSLMAAMMEGDEEQAVAQLRFFRNLLGRLENTRWGRFIIQQIRRRYCNANGK